MFSELPKLFGRDFAIGFMLPAAIFTGAILVLIYGFGLEREWIPRLATDVLDVAALVVATWLWATLLLGLNRSLYQLLEGYGTYNPIRVVSERLGWEARRHESLMERIRELDVATANGRVSEREELERAELMQRSVEEFPEATHRLPTRFGNAIRAFETYSQTMYGLDDIPGWIRLMAVMPKDYASLVNEAKAQTDFWVNLWVQGFLLLGAYLGFGLLAWSGPGLGLREVPLLWFPFASLLLAWFASRRAKTAAIEWGETVKAAYDVFLPELRTKLQFEPATDAGTERRMWEAFSQAIIYRYPELIPRARALAGTTQAATSSPPARAVDPEAVRAPAEETGRRERKEPAPSNP